MGGTRRSISCTHASRNGSFAKVRESKSSVSKTALISERRRVCIASSPAICRKRAVVPWETVSDPATTMKDASAAACCLDKGGPPELSSCCNTKDQQRASDKRLSAYDDSQNILFDATIFFPGWDNLFTGKLGCQYHEFWVGSKKNKLNTCWNVTIGPGCGSNAIRSRIHGTCPKTMQCRSWV